MRKPTSYLPRVGICYPSARRGALMMPAEDLNKHLDSCEDVAPGWQCAPELVGRKGRKR